MAHDHVEGIVKRAEAMTDWGGQRRYVRLDLEVQGGGTQDAKDFHLYVPGRHSWATLQPGQKVKFVVC